MKFIITKTSAYDEKPCKEAKRTMVETWHTRTCSEKEFNLRFSDREGLWKSKGKNHSITKEGYITRQQDDREAWCVELNSLEELIKFCNKYGQLIVSNEGYDYKNASIEIYDDYRE
jgi:hypothetical protein